MYLAHSSQRQNYCYLMVPASFVDTLVSWFLRSEKEVNGKFVLTLGAGLITFEGVKFYRIPFILFVLFILFLQVTYIIVFYGFLE